MKKFLLGGERDMEIEKTLKCRCFPSVMYLSMITNENNKREQ